MSQAWEYDGIDLTRHGYNVRLLGAPLNTPARRGDNVVVPHKDGRLYVPKMFDQRVQTLAMWAIHEPVDGGTGTEADMLAHLDALRGLFARAGQHTLKFQFGSAVRTATVEVVRQVEFEPKVFNAAYVFVVEFLMADPLWYAESKTTVGPTIITMSSQNITINNAGTYESQKAIFTITGPITNPILTIGAIWMKYTGSVGSGSTLVIDCGAWTAKLDGVDVSGNISHDGALCWLPIPVSTTNSLNVASSGYTSGTTVKVQFYAPYV